MTKTTKKVATIDPKPLKGVTFAGGFFTCGVAQVEKDQIINGTASRCKAYVVVTTEYDANGTLVKLTVSNPEESRGYAEILQKQISASISRRAA